MSLWGNREVIANTSGQVELANTGTVTGTGTDFDTELQVGNYIRVGNREYRITDIANTTSMTVTAGPGLEVPDTAANNYTASEKPVYLTASMIGTHANNVFFVDSDEIMDSNNAAKGMYGAGWMHVTTYVDSANNTRYKSEILVAMSRTAAEAGDLGGDDDVVE